MGMKRWIGIFIVCLLIGCTTNQQMRLAERFAPIEKSHNLKIIREALGRPALNYSLHLIPIQGNFLLKATHLPINERFLLATVDRLTNKMEIRSEFEVLSDGSLKLFKQGKEQVVDFLSFQPQGQDLLYGKQIDYILVHKKQVSSSIAHFLPHPLKRVGEHGESLSLLATHPLLTRFQLEGKGFSPHEVMELIHRTGDRVEKRELVANQTGEFELPLTPLIFGQLGGEATLTLVSGRGTLEYTYPWGGKLERQTYAQHSVVHMAFVANQLPHQRDQDPYQNRMCSL